MPEPMTDARLEEIRELKGGLLSECVREIDRLRAELRSRDEFDAEQREIDSR